MNLEQINRIHRALEALKIDPDALILKMEQRLRDKAEEERWDWLVENMEVTA